MAGKTKEEKFLLRAYDLASKSGDMQFPINRYDIGKSIGFSPKGVDTICQVLLRANFIRKAENEGDILVTKRGEELALMLIRGG